MSREQKSSKKVNTAIELAFKELLSLSIEQLEDRLKNREIGPIGRLHKDMVDLDPEYSKIVDENFWDLI